MESGLMEAISAYIQAKISERNPKKAQDTRLFKANTEHVPSLLFDAIQLPGIETQETACIGNAEYFCQSSMSEKKFLNVQ